MFITDPAKMAQALRKAGDKYVAVRLVQNNCVYEAIKIVGVSDDEDPVVTFMRYCPPPPTPGTCLVSGLRNIIIEF